MTEQGETAEQALLAHAERQTKALENMNWVLMFLFVLGLVTAGIWLIGLVG